MALDGVASRDAAERLKGATVHLERAELPDLEPGEFYVDDLVGMEVYCGEELLGRIESSRAQGGIEVVRVANATEEIEVPLVNGYVERLDLSGRRLEVSGVDELPRTPVLGTGRRE